MPTFIEFLQANQDRLKANIVIKFGEALNKNSIGQLGRLFDKLPTFNELQLYDNAYALVDNSRQRNTWREYLLAKICEDLFDVNGNIKPEIEDLLNFKAEDQAESFLEQYEKKTLSSDPDSMTPETRKVQRRNELKRYLINAYIVDLVGSNAQLTPTYREKISKLSPEDLQTELQTTMDFFNNITSTLPATIDAIFIANLKSRTQNNLNDAIKLNPDKFDEFLMIHRQTLDKRAKPLAQEVHNEKALSKISRFFDTLPRREKTNQLTDEFLTAYNNNNLDTWINYILAQGYEELFQNGKLRPEIKDLLNYEYLHSYTTASGEKIQEVRKFIDQFEQENPEALKTQLLSGYLVWAAPPELITESFFTETANLDIAPLEMGMALSIINKRSNAIKAVDETYVDNIKNQTTQNFITAIRIPAAPAPAKQPIPREIEAQHEKILTDAEKEFANIYQNHPDIDALQNALANLEKMLLENKNKLYEFRHAYTETWGALQDLKNKAKPSEIPEYEQAEQRFSAYITLSSGYNPNSYQENPLAIQSQCDRYTKIISAINAVQKKLFSAHQKNNENLLHNAEEQTSTKSQSSKKISKTKDILTSLAKKIQTTRSQGKPSLDKLLFSINKIKTALQPTLKELEQLKDKCVLYWNNLQKLKTQVTPEERLQLEQAQIKIVKYLGYNPENGDRDLSNPNAILKQIISVKEVITLVEEIHEQIEKQQQQTKDSTEKKEFIVPTTVNPETDVLDFKDSSKLKDMAKTWMRENKIASAEGAGAGLVASVELEAPVASIEGTQVLGLPVDKVMFCRETSHEETAVWSASRTPERLNYHIHTCPNKLKSQTLNAIMNHAQQVTNQKPNAVCVVNKSVFAEATLIELEAINKWREKNGHELIKYRNNSGVNTTGFLFKRKVNAKYKELEEAEKIGTQLDEAASVIQALPKPAPQGVGGRN